MVLQYKCPDCGADMVFDSKSGMLRCESCGREENIENMKNFNSKQEGSNQEQDTNSFEDFVHETQYSTYGDDNAVQYQCKNCGAVLITDADTSATTCNFCGAPMILGDRLSGELAPSRVIPFKINKQEATAAFKKWCKKGRLTPNGFMSADRIKSITGIYVPFWLFDLNCSGDAQADCTRVKHYTDGDYNVTETEHYDVYRRFNIYYDKIPCDASEKMDDKMMDKLEPFDYSELKVFNTPYLAGYIAEKYNYTDKDLLPRVTKRSDSFVNGYVRDSIIGYDTITILNKNVNTTPLNADYTLLPVWMICYDYEKNEHCFAMNGQTGKVIGKPPLSKFKIAAWFGGLTAVFFVIARIITLILGGPIL